MGTTFVGDRANVNDPNGAPESGRAPAATVPVDGDPRNASTYQAGYKALADWLDWLRRPIAKVADWANPLKRYQSALGHTRFRVDHMGFPGGWFQEMSPNWLAAASVSGAAADVALIDGWVANGLGSAGNLDGQSATSDYPAYRLALTPSAIGDHFAIKTSSSVASFTDTVCAVLEGVFRVESGGVPGYRDYVVGMGVHAAGSPVDWAECIRLRYNQVGSGTGTILAETRTGGVLTTVDSGIAPGNDVTVPFRIEFHGATVGDNATRRAVFFVNGTLVANITTNIPVASSFRLFAGWKEIVGGGDAEHMHVGPLKFRSSLTTFDAK